MSKLEQAGHELRVMLRNSSALVSLIVAGLAPGAQAGTLPTGGGLAAGNATIATNGTTTTITQTSQNAVINWASFSVGAGNAVVFQDASANSATLNRVTGSATSIIAGQIISNGTVYLVNPNGIAITSSGTVQTGGGFVASSLDIADADFMAGRLNFAGKGASKLVSNAGRISAGQGAYVALLGGAVANAGTISVPLGKLGMGSGEQVALDINGGNFMQVAVPTALVTGSNALVSNSGEIVVSGGAVQMKAAVLKEAVRNVINMSGAISADSATGNGGTIQLIGGADTTSMAGQVTVSGTLSARATGASGNGGEIETSGQHVNLNGSTVTTAAAHGKAGTWLIDPVDFTVAASGGDETGAALTTALTNGNVIIQSSQGASGTNGDININDVVSWSANTLTLDAARNINVNAVMSASGAAGFVGITGDTAQNGTSTGGALNFGLGASGFYGRLDLATTGSFALNGTNYTIITTLGAPGSTTGTDLQGINGNLSDNYVLGANIDASATAGWNGGFTSLGTNGSGVALNSYHGFTGNLDGLGHTVSALTISQANGSLVGLFGYTSTGSSLSNIGVAGGSVTASQGIVVGALVGLSSSTITNVYATANVSGLGYVGGLVGAAYYGSISNAFATGSVTSSNSSGGGYAGGLVGQSYVAITNSYATGNVSGYADIGGLVGDNEGSISGVYASGTVTAASGKSGGLVGENNGSINDAYATGSVYGLFVVGGLVGANGGTSVTNSYASGAVTVTSPLGHAGGLFGDSNGLVSNSYWDTYSTGLTNAVGVGTNAGSTAVTSDPTQTSAANYAFNPGAYAFSDPANWMIQKGVRPMGVWEEAPIQGGTAFIGNAHQLQLLNASNATLSTNAKLTGNIDLTGTGAIATCTAAETCNPASYAGMWSQAGFVALGSDGAGHALNNGSGYSGTFDGGGFTVSNLTINQATGGYAGLFGFLAFGGSISNIGILGGSVMGPGGYTGALVGNNQGSITNAYSTASVSGGSGFGVGGLVGLNSEGFVSNVYATGSVSGAGDIGGLVGANNGGYIVNTYATGAVTSAGAGAGGLVGSNNGAIATSYATGAVSGVDGFVGGLAGSSAGTITNSYYDTQTTGQSYGIGSGTGGAADMAGTVMGLTTADMMQAENFTGFDIDTVGGQNNVWRVYESNTMPLLKVFLTAANVTGNLDSTSVTYNGQNQANATGSGYTATLASDASAANRALILGALAYSCSGGDGSCANVGTYSVAANGGLYSSQQGYDLIFSPPFLSHAGLIISPAALTLTYTANAAGSTYGGAIAPVSGTASAAGLVNGDTLASFGTASWTTSATASSNAGRYTITGSGLANGNYTITAQQAVGNASAYTVSPAALTLTYTANAARVVFGQPFPALSGTATVSGLVNGDTWQTALFGQPNWTTSATGGMPFSGSYPIYGAGLTASANYVLNLVQAGSNSAALTITPSSQALTDFLPSAVDSKLSAGVPRRGAVGLSCTPTGASNANRRGDLVSLTYSGWICRQRPAAQ